MRKVEAYLKEVERTLRLPRKDREAVIAELRGHIAERLREAHRDPAGLPDDDVEALVLRELGDARELAISYGRDTTIHTRRGEVAVRVARAVGRGTALTLKWLGIVAAVLLVVGLATAYVVYQEAKPTLAYDSRRMIYTSEVECTDLQACPPTPTSDSFDAPDDAHSVELSLNGRVERGSVRVQVWDSAGNSVLDKTYSATTTSARIDERRSWAAAEGPWTVTVTPTAYVGTIMLQAMSVGAAVP